MNILSTVGGKSLRSGKLRSLAVHSRFMSAANGGELDTLIKNAAVVFADKKDPQVLDLGIKDGKFVEITAFINIIVYSKYAALWVDIFNNLG